MNDWLQRIWLRIRRTRSEADIEHELRIHLELASEENRDLGVPRHEADRIARLKLGSSTLAIAERVSDGELMTRLEACWQDLAAGCRAVKDSPIFSVTAILTLAVGVGANTAVFSVLYGLFLRGLPVQSPGELASIAISLPQPGDESRLFMPYRMVEAFRAEQHAFAEIGVWDLGTVSMADRNGTLRLFDAGLVDGETFHVLGISPHLGRFMLRSDDNPPARGDRWSVVLGYRFWRDRFGGDPNIVGSRIEISGAPALIVGVTPPDFEGLSPGVEPKVYLPFRFVSIMAAEELLDDPAIFYWCSAIGRLQPGVTVKQANAEARFLRKSLFRDGLPAEVQRAPEVRNAQLRVRSARSGLRSEYAALYSEPLFLLQGLVLVVLGLCCVNVGGLMMARVYTRQREFAVRSAIGAGRLRLTRQYLTESFVIALAGSALGGVVAWFGRPALLHFFRDPRMFEPAAMQPGGTVFWVSALSAAATTLLFGTLPALRASRTDCGVLLRSCNVGGDKGQRSVRAFIPVQVALSLALVAIAALLSQSLTLIRGQHRGFDVDHVTIQTPPFHRLPQRGNAKLDLYQQVVDRIEQSPGVRSAAITWYTPMSGQQSMGSFTTANGSGNSVRTRYLAYNLVGPGYFRTMETKIISGREFQPRERDLSVCVLNRAAAANLFANRSALGQYVRNELSDALEARTSCRVVGIAEDAKFASLRDPSPPTIYYPVIPQNGRMRTNFVFLINANTKAQAIEAYRKAIAELAPAIPLVLFVTLREQMDAALASERLITILSNLFACVALLLSAIGLYGLLSSSVAQRTGEIGVRIALGACRRRVVAVILAEAIALLATGMTLGAGVLFLFIRLLDKMLFGVSGFEPAVWLASFGLMAAVTLGAASVPAIRAASMDPMRILRVD